MAVKPGGNFLRWLKDPEVNIYLIVDGRGMTLAKERKYMKEGLANKSMRNWAIHTKEGVLIGVTAINKIDKKHKKCSWGIFIGDKNYWGKGLGTDTLRTIIKYVFTKLKLNRIELGVFPYNHRGKRCYEKCGFKVEGVKRQAVYKSGKFIDDIVMGITKSDYKKLINK